MGNIDQIILSCNEDETYSSFWKPVAYAYSKMFPDVTVHLAFVTNRGEDDPLVQEYRKYGKVTLFKPYSHFPEFGQAKMARFVLASMQGDDVCYVDDIDLFPLRKDFITDKTSERPKDHLLCVGGEVYGNNGCFPVSQMTAEGYIWKKFINPESLDFHNLIEWYWKLPTKYSINENIGVINNFAVNNFFSDEALIYKLRSMNPVNIYEMKRGYNQGDLLNVTLDRCDWKMNEERLKEHKYVNAHGIRPYSAYVKEYEPLMNYIDENYCTK